ncbi:MAG: hypothetical protein WKF87_09380 [Chryseolinea sp.]
MKLKFKYIAFTIALIGLSETLSAQEKSSYRTNNFFDLALSGGNGKFSGALSWSHINTLTKKIPNLKVGYGIRFTSFVAANKFYATAPAKYTSSVQNLGTIFSETIDENIDTIATATASTNSLNVTIHIEYSITPKLGAGINIDLVGFSFGPEKTFNVISSSFDPNQSPVQQGSPTRFNLLLTSDNDIGSLNSEFFLRYRLGEKISVRAGVTFVFSEYELSNELSFDNGRIMNARYRHKAAMGMIGLTYKPFN